MTEPMQDKCQTNETNNSAKTVNILSIDAWCDGISHCDAECPFVDSCKCYKCDDDHECAQCVKTWSWNVWYKVGDCDLGDLPTGTDHDGILRYMCDNGYIKPKGVALCEIDDDCYNYVVREIATGMPLYAIAYGDAE